MKFILQLPVTEFDLEESSDRARGISPSALSLTDEEDEITDSDIFSMQNSLKDVLFPWLEIPSSEVECLRLEIDTETNEVKLLKTNLIQDSTIKAESTPILNLDQKPILIKENRV